MVLFIGLIIFGIVSAIHLYFCFIENEKYRKITKPMLLGILFITFLIHMIVTENYNIFVLVAIILGLIGDIFLIFNKTKIFFTIGAGFFATGHICYLSTIILKLDVVLPWYFYVCMLVCLLIWLFISYPQFKKIMGITGFGCSIYGFELLLGIALGVIKLANNEILSGILLVIGFIIFFISDCLVTYESFVKKVKRSNFYIMITYLIAQLLIILGIIL